MKGDDFMAAMENKIGSSLILRKVVSTTLEGKEVCKTQRFSKVKITATAQDIFDIAEAMSALIVYPVKEILKEDTSTVING